MAERVQHTAYQVSTATALVEKIAELLLNNKLQMSACGATEGLVTLTKQLKIGLREQVRVN